LTINGVTEVNVSKKPGNVKYCIPALQYKLIAKTHKGLLRIYAESRMYLGRLNNGTPGGCEPTKS